MWKFAILLLVFLVRDAQSQSCQCYETGTLTGSSAPISNSYNTNDFSPCYTKCSYVAYSGNDTYGWTDLTFNWANVTGSGGIIQIFDGPTASGTPIIQLSEGENVSSGSLKNLIKSSSSRITISYLQTNETGAPNVYYGVIKAKPGLQPPAATTTTTLAPTTRTYNSPIFKNDPFLITHDILVVVNQKTSGGISALTQLNAIAINFVTLLSVTNVTNSASQTRLSLATLTPYDPYYSIRGMIWGLYPNDVIANLPRSGVTIEGNIDQALMGLADLAFTVNNKEDNSTDTRRNVQRSVILLTAEWPTTNADLSDNVQTKFVGKGVDLLVVGYKLTDTEQSQLLRSDHRWYNAINANISNPTAVASFVNPFYFNDLSAQNYWCPPFPITQSSDKTYSWFQEPYNYDGPYGPVGTANWKTHDPFDGQTKRYCNFADNQYTYNLPEGAIGMQVQVFFELEAGKDVLSFYDASNNLIASFTGYEISASSFYTTTPVLTARFRSDNQNVYRGFYVSITNVLP